MIPKLNGKYIVLSERTGRMFRSYQTREKVEKRLRQIEFFKHVRKRTGRAR